MDNRSNALAEDDAAELLALLKDSERSGLLGAAGYDDQAVNELLARGQQRAAARC